MATLDEINQSFFRAWGKNSNTMHYDYSETDRVKQAVETVNIGAIFGSTMRGTQVLDITGRQIFEGDFLQYSGLTGLVYYDVSRGKYTLKGQTDDLCEFSKVGIIAGNFYSDPHLLRYI